MMTAEATCGLRHRFSSFVLRHSFVIRHSDFVIRCICGILIDRGRRMYENTEFTLNRDCEAIQIPSGQKMTIPAGTQGVITQSLGGSYTIATYQGLARVAESDLEALGLEKPQPRQTQTSARTDGEVSEEDVWNQLRQCYDPEIPVNIVDLGLVYDCRLTKKEDGSTRVDVKMTLTA